jgi:hypothetical protein
LVIEDRLDGNTAFKSCVQHQASYSEMLKNGRWYALIVCKESKPLQTPTVDFKKAVGIDLGITKFIHDFLTIMG